MSEPFNGVQVRLWEGPGPATRQAILKQVADERLPVQFWENEPDYRYSVHDHPYQKVIYVLKGSIMFILPDLGKQIDLQIGDRLTLPAGVRHAALVGPDGVQCLEAHVV